MILLLLVIISSCARKYTVIDPSRINLSNTTPLTETIEISYRFGIQELAGNKPYIRKEVKKNMRLLAISIKNNGDSPVFIEKERFRITNSQGNSILILPNSVYSQKVRQYAELFSTFYGLAGFGIVVEQTPNGTYTSLTYSFIPLIIGIGNSIFATVSNNRQLKYLDENTIFNKAIQPNSIVYGVIAVNHDGFDQLRFEYLESGDYAK